VFLKDKKYLYLSRYCPRRGIRDLLMMKASWRHPQSREKGTTSGGDAMTHTDGGATASKLYLVIGKEILASDSGLGYVE
jgi:hypothetical protein